jgi:hypothetical protein
MVPLGERILGQHLIQAKGMRTSQGRHYEAIEKSQKKQAGVGQLGQSTLQ